MAEKITKVQFIEIPLQDLIDLYLPKYGLDATQVKAYYDETKTALVFEVAEVDDTTVDVPEKP